MNTEVGLLLLAELKQLNSNLEERNNLKKLELHHSMGAGFGSTLKGRYNLIRSIDEGKSVKCMDLYDDKTLKRIKGE